MFIFDIFNRFILTVSNHIKYLFIFFFLRSWFHRTFLGTLSWTSLRIFFLNNLLNFLNRFAASSLLSFIFYTLLGTSFTLTLFAFIMMDFLYNIIFPFIMMYKFFFDESLSWLFCCMLFIYFFVFVSTFFSFLWLFNYGSLLNRGFFNWLIMRDFILMNCINTLVLYNSTSSLKICNHGVYNNIRHFTIVILKMWNNTINGCFSLKINNSFFYLSFSRC